MAVLPPLHLSFFVLSAPILYYYCSSHTLSVIILYAHAFCIAIWFSSIPEIRLLLHNILGLSSGEQFVTSADEMYGLQHAIYNMRVNPPTYWFNMGLWDGSNQNFADACRALVYKVIDQLGGHAKVDDTRLLGTAIELFVPILDMN